MLAARHRDYLLVVPVMAAFLVLAVVAVGGQFRLVPLVVPRLVAARCIMATLLALHV